MKCELLYRERVIKQINMVEEQVITFQDQYHNNRENATCLCQHPRFQQTLNQN